MSIFIASPTLLIWISWIICSLSSYLLFLFKLVLIFFIFLFAFIHKLINLLVFLSLLLFKFFHLFFKKLSFLLIELGNLFLCKHTAIKCKSFLKRIYNFYRLRICFQNAIRLLFYCLLKFLYNLFNFTFNIDHILVFFSWAEIIIFINCFLNLFFTKTEHFLNLQDNLISTIITHYNGKQMWVFWIYNSIASMINWFFINSSNFFQFLIHFIGFFLRE